MRKKEIMWIKKCDFNEYLKQFFNIMLTRGNKG